MFGRKSVPIQVGDRFIKAGDSNGKLWEVTRIWTTVDGIPHTRLKNLSHLGETRIISVQTLASLQFYIPAPPPPAER
ncbi:conserved hypothetical protein [Candidatus Terasakiella magnetica]|nr:conserved hypothetical protein [Candidatus Terasakiella magnetica]